MKLKIITTLVLAAIILGSTLNGQVGINDDGSSPDSSAVLDLKSTNKGFLPPRMTISERNSIGSPPAGLIIYCIDCDEMQLFNGTKWTNMIRGNATFLPTITIGGQTWMSRNLNIGTMINQFTNMTNNNILEKYCFDNLEVNCDLYGALYQWDEIMQYVTTESTKGVCPTGWHLPSDAEWKTLEMELGMSQSQADATNFRGTDQGSQLAGNEPLWKNGDLDQNAAFGSSGFGAIPSGYRFTDGSFFGDSIAVDFWSSSESGSNAWIRDVFNFDSTIDRRNFDKTYGFSVRCVQDANNLNYIISTGSGVFTSIVGEIKIFAGSSIPASHLICDGASYLRDDYEELFNAIGTTFGEGDSPGTNTTFNIPDLRKAVPIHQK